MRLFILIGLGLLAACAESGREPDQAGENGQSDISKTIDADLVTVFDEYNIASAAAGVIQDGALVWAGYYGEQSEGVPVTSETIFNVGSVTKTVTAETIIRLVEKGEMSLEESMSAHWIDPDLVEDARHESLTPRIALTHSTGFPNWRYSDPEFKLRFMRDPGTAFGYSGEGYEYLATFAEKKTGQTFNALANTEVLEPLGLASTSVSPQPWVIERIVRPVDEEGVRHAPFCTGPDERRCAATDQWSAADELATTVEDYAAFMIAVMNGEGVSNALQADRFTVHVSSHEDDILKCALPDEQDCPIAQGYGLGWEIFEFHDAKIISHGGSDWSERAMVYFDPETRDGVILFLNGPSSTSVEALIAGLNILDPGSKIAMLYRGWVDAYMARQEAASTQ